MPSRRNSADSRSRSTDSDDEGCSCCRALADCCDGVRSVISTCLTALKCDGFTSKHRFHHEPISGRDFSTSQKPAVVRTTQPQPPEPPRPPEPREQLVLPMAEQNDSCKQPRWTEYRFLNHQNFQNKRRRRVRAS